MRSSRSCTLCRGWGAFLFLFLWRRLGSLEGCVTGLTLLNNVNVGMMKKQAAPVHDWGCLLMLRTRSTPPLLRLVLTRRKADRFFEGADEVGVVVEAGQLARIRDRRAFAEQLLRFVNALK